MPNTRRVRSWICEGRAALIKIAGGRMFGASFTSLLPATMIDCRVMVQATDNAKNSTHRTKSHGWNVSGFEGV
ncbi:hypothetical protein RRF57_003781 [Xylaria bambusicola]|uniref:Uncharacterized protein n=1 Tax=Xylaria bambusicola TaxID=326684 RepID=A0AAN7UKU2_9PEZI